MKNHCFLEFIGLAKLVWFSWKNAWLQKKALKIQKSLSKKTWRAWVRNFQAPLKTKKKLNEKAEWDQAKKNKFFWKSPFSKSRFSKIFM